MSGETEKLVPEPPCGVLADTGTRLTASEAPLEGSADILVLSISPAAAGSDGHGAGAAASRGMPA